MVVTRWQGVPKYGAVAASMVDGDGPTSDVVDRPTVLCGGKRSSSWNSERYLTI